MTNYNVSLGLLSPATPNRPHFKPVDALLPSGVTLIHEGLGLLGESYQDLASNPAMFWNMLSKLGVKESVKNYGRLVSTWPLQSKE
ncbi:MAG: hypothetical protein FJ143_10610 [Deltaproteobacteria bacterium]|nr:hypothetical protein [Deltaproteobacteria bacterium]